MRKFTIVLLLAMPAPTRAQAPATAPLALLLPASARAVSLGNAMTAGRDDYIVFYNPAQIAATAGFSMSLARYAQASGRVTAASGAVVGRLNLAWGMQFVAFQAAANTEYPFVPAALTEHGPVNAMSFVTTAAASFAFKGFRVGLGMKYAEDRVTESLDGGFLPAIHHGMLLGDFGLSRPLLSGTAAVTLQNVSGRQPIQSPKQVSAGWSRSMSLEQIDLTFGGAVTSRDGWVTGGGGVEVGYGWIEGWSAAGRIGAHRPETDAQNPIALGGTLNADRLSFDYAVEFFDGERYVHHLTLRWR